MPYPFFRRRNFSKWRRPFQPKGWIGALLGIGLAVVLIAGISARLHPVMVSMALAKVSNEATKVLDGAISERLSVEGTTYQELITLEKDDQGRITALTSNIVALNHLRTELLSTVVQAIDGLSRQELSIPAGNLTGISFLSGRGMTLPVEVVSVGTAHAEFENVFSAAGINQTRHQIMLDLRVTVDVLLPGETVRTEVPAQVCVAETVIVGEVPGTYLQMGA
jgi:sporulation protein YunB